MENFGLKFAIKSNLTYSYVFLNNDSAQPFIVNRNPYKISKNFVSILNVFTNFLRYF